MGKGFEKRRMREKDSTSLRFSVDADILNLITLFLLLFFYFVFPIDRDNSIRD